jgi:hypothetical protein
MQVAYSASSAAHAVADSEFAQGSPKAIPTILVASPNRRLRESLVRSLTQGSRNILQADCEHGVLDFIRLHSRPIHCLLIDVVLDNGGLLASVRKYRRETEVVLLADESSAQNIRGVLTPEAAVMKAQRSFTES